MKRTRPAFLIVIACWMCTCGWAAVHHVPAQHTNIQDAIKAAQNGDTVVVAPGRYNETLDFLGKTITVSGTNPEDWAVVQATVVDAQGQDSVVSFTRGEGPEAVLTGLTLTGGAGQRHPVGAYSDEDRFGGGICCYQAAPTISRNIIENNVTRQSQSPPATPGRGRARLSAPQEVEALRGHGGGIFCYDASITVKENIIRNNQAEQGGGLHLDCYSEAVHIVGNTICLNQATNYGAGAYVYSSGGQFNGNLVYGNTAQHGYGGVELNNFSHFCNNTIVDNHADWNSNGSLDIYLEGLETLICNNIIASTTGERVDFRIHAQAYQYEFAYNNIWSASTSGLSIPPDLIGVQGNISVDPCFVDAQAQDYHLTALSACISAGDPDTTLDNLPKDMDDQTRINAQRIDMGADEYHGHVPPFAELGTDRHVLSAGQVVSLDGSASFFHPVSSRRSYQWTQVGGPDVSLAQADQATASFTPVAEGDYVFELGVHDGLYAGRPEQILVVVGNTAPVPVTPKEVIGIVDHTVVLDGRMSFDPDPEDELAFAWAQVEGAEVDLVDANQAVASFVCPGAGTYVFALVVADSLDQSDPCAVTVEVFDVRAVTEDLVPAPGRRADQIDGDGYQMVYTSISGQACRTSYDMTYLDLLTNQTRRWNVGKYEFTPRIDGDLLAWAGGEDSYSPSLYVFDMQRGIQIELMTVEDTYYMSYPLDISNQTVYAMVPSQGQYNWRPDLVCFDISNPDLPEMVVLAQAVDQPNGENAFAVDGRWAVWASYSGIWAADTSDVNNVKLVEVSDNYRPKYGVDISGDTVVWGEVRPDDPGDILGADLSDPENIYRFSIVEKPGKQASPTIHGSLVAYVDTDNGIRASWLGKPHQACPIRIAPAGMDLMGDKPVLSGNMLAWIRSELPQAISIHLASSAAEGPIQNLSTGAMFQTIQNAVAVAQSGEEIVIQPGHYQESLTLRGKAVTLRSVDPTDPWVVAQTVIQGSPDKAVVTVTGKRPLLLEGLTLSGGMEGVRVGPQGTCCLRHCQILDQQIGVVADCAKISLSHCCISGQQMHGIELITPPKADRFSLLSDLDHCVIADNGQDGIHGGEIFVQYCTIANNQGYGIASQSGQVSHSIVYGNQQGAIDALEIEVQYSDIQGGFPGSGNLDEDPLFVGTGDYHLQSQTGHWNPAQGVWILDGQTSPAIDVGDPQADFSQELEPHGSCVNIGAYGNTVQASLSSE